MNCTIIVAIGKNGEIGKNNQLLWHLPADMQFFKTTTVGHTVVMGRKNWESIPEKFRPLPNRENIILSRDKNYLAKGGLVISDLAEMETILRKHNQKIYIIGGAQIYKIALDKGWINEMIITHVDASFDADAFFPPVDFSTWNTETLHTHLADEKNPYSFVIKKYSK